MSAAALLDRLALVRQTGPGRWIARCPSHPDRSPSLSIRELEDGRILLHDFGGCETHHVLAALGLEMGDLFPARVPADHPPSRRSIPARDLLEIVSEEVTVVASVAATLRTERTVSDEDWQRLVTAVGRIQRVRDSLHPGRGA